VTAHGEVWLVRLDKVRPAIVLTRDPTAAHLHQVLVAPVTSTVRGIPVEVPVGYPDGINRPSVTNLDMVQLVDRQAFVRRLGRARPSTMDAVCDALHYAIGC
jgi:mRNA interferase MazF